MDPFSIAATAFSLAGSIASTSMVLVDFVRNVRDASDDIEAVSTELRALAAVLDPVARSLSRARDTSFIPEVMADQVDATLRGCSLVVEQIGENVKKYQRDKVWTKAKWAVFGQEETRQLRESLEAYKMALSLGLHAISINTGQEIKDDTAVIREYVAAVKINTDDILDRVNSIRLSDLPRSGDARVHQWIEDMAVLSTYAETAYQGTIVPPEGLSDDEPERVEDQNQAVQNPAGPDSSPNARQAYETTAAATSTNQPTAERPAMLAQERSKKYENERRYPVSNSHRSRRRRLRTPEEQAAHEMSKEERRRFRKLGEEAAAETLKEEELGSSAPSRGGLVNNRPPVPSPIPSSRHFYSTPIPDSDSEQVAPAGRDLADNRRAKISAFDESSNVELDEATVGSSPRRRPHAPVASYPIERRRTRQQERKPKEDTQKAKGIRDAMKKFFSG